MSLEQEKPINNPDKQPSSTNVERFKVSENSPEITFVPTPDVTTTAMEEELSIEPVVKIIEETPTNPTTQTHARPEKVLELLKIAEEKIDEDAGNAKKVTDEFNKDKAAA
jgi:hypothetical protein